MVVCEGGKTLLSKGTACAERQTRRLISTLCGAMSTTKAMTQWRGAFVDEGKVGGTTRSRSPCEFRVDDKYIQ